MKTNSFSLVAITIALLGAQMGYPVSPQERKSAWNSPAPRGVKSRSPSGSGSSASSSGSRSGGAPSNASNGFSYSKMGEDFAKEIKKSNDEFMKSLPKIEEEKDYLKELERAGKTVKNSTNGLSVEASLLSQYTAAILSTMQETTQIQLNLIAEQRRALSKAQAKQQIEAEKQERAEKLHGLSPIAIALGAAQLSPGLSPSPISIRTQTNQIANHQNKNTLFPRGITSITSKAYNSPPTND